jgi:plasmid stabilization system protein ParE
MSSLEIRWTERAENDLFEAFDFIARNNPAAATRWSKKILQKVEDLAASPMRGRTVPEAAGSDLREVFHGRYRIVYAVRHPFLHVVTVFEGSGQFSPPANDEQG